MRCARWRTTSRVWSIAAIAAIVATAGSAPSAARANQKTDKKSAEFGEPEPRTLRTDDGVSLHITYYKSTAEKEAPVVVLLHMKDGNRFVWQNEGGFARRLQSEGYAVVTVDLRYHGESKLGGAVGVGNANQGGGKKKGKKAAGLDLKQGDYNAMFEFDMEAVKEFIKEEHQAGNLNMNKMGIVGPEMGASIAAFYAALDWAKAPYEDAQPGFQTPRGQDVRALVLISPENSYHGLTLAKVAPELKDPEKQIAILVCAGSDARDKAQSEKVYDMFLQPPAQNKKRMHYRPYPAKLSGTDLLGKKLGIEEDMLVFFGEHLKKIDSPWRDRRSKRERLEKKK